MNEAMAHHVAPHTLTVLRIVTRMNIGGPAVHALILSSRLDSARVTTHVVIGRPEATEGDLSGLLQGSHVRVTQIRTLGRSLHPWNDLVSFARLLTIVWQDRPRILHTHMAKAGALGRLAGLLYNRMGPGRHPHGRAILIHTFHGHVLDGYFAPWLSRVFLAVERWLARRTDCLIAVSQRIRDQLLAKGIGQPSQWQVVPLGLDLAGLSEVPSSNNGHALVQIGMVGRLVPVKNPGLFLQALTRIVRQPAGREVSGVVVGDGPLRGALEQEAERLGLGGAIHFTGWQRDMRAVYQELDVVCLTSWNEGTPVALIEAMAAARAVIATDVGGVRDLLAEHPSQLSSIVPGTFQVTERGVLVRPGDLEGLTLALGHVTGDVALRLRLGEAARAFVVKQFRQERLVQDMMALYETLLKEREG